MTMQVARLPEGRTILCLFPLQKTKADLTHVYYNICTIMRCQLKSLYNYFQAIDEIVTVNEGSTSAVPRNRPARLAHLGSLAGRIAGGMLAEGLRQIARGNCARASGPALTPSDDSGC
jgi:hypothetical protein